MILNALKNLLRQEVAYFLCMHSSFPELVIIMVFMPTETCSSLDLTKAKYSISKQSIVEKENVIVRINHSGLIFQYACCLLVCLPPCMGCKNYNHHQESKRIKLLLLF
jgi:hypothetical protein